MVGHTVRGGPAMLAVLLAVLLTAVLAMPQTHLKTHKCRKTCHNRYGKSLCCDSVPQNEFPRCPPMPRILVDCSDPGVMHKAVNIEVCKSDNDCKKNELCCDDICNTKQTVCMPSKVNIYYLFP
ncbi:uncharacterized protein [Cherax quadricarinatus]|uniref:uncharacterized protein n=1 Tax=Cherax quadricarinatus TaxID=27406 RepID=UPI00237987FC|nr:uncharacterized protein LOC128689686 [Cherax quadricarinatus]